MKNRITQTVARKRFKDHAIYKVFDELDGEVINLRAVRQIGNNFEYTTNLSLKEEEFVYADTIQELESGIEREMALETLCDYERNLLANARTILEVTALVDEEVIDMRSLGGHSYALTRNEENVGVPMVRYLFGDKNGKVGYEGPVPNDETMRDIIAMDLVERPYDSAPDQVYQIGQNEYLLLGQHKEVIVVVPLALQEEKDGELSWLSNTDLLKFIKLDDEGNAHLIKKPEGILPTTKDAQEFLGEKTQQLTERVIMNN